MVCSTDGHVHHDDHHHDDHHHDGHTCVHSQLVEPELRKFMDKVTSIPMVSSTNHDWFAHQIILFSSKPTSSCLHKGIGYINELQAR